MTITAGIDLGTSAIKGVLIDHRRTPPVGLARAHQRIRRRDPLRLASELYAAMLAETGLGPNDIAYVATTGEGRDLPFATGHFVSITAHARGAVHLDPQARAVLDVGALHGRAIAIDGRGRVLASRMTSQCASGSGRFLEDIARSLGISEEEIGPMSLIATEARDVSGICAVLAETDVINMVSRNVPVPDILKGIHRSIASRLVRLVEGVGVREGTVLVTGGLGRDIGLLAALNGAMHEREVKMVAKSHPDAVQAGALGAAFWGAFRHGRLARSGNRGWRRSSD